MSLDTLCTIESAAAVLELSAGTLRRWQRQGRIHGHTLSPVLWPDLLDFTTARPTAYFSVREVLAEASRPSTKRPPVLSELLEPVAYVRPLSA